jgi:hypothetical protein
VLHIADNQCLLLLLLLLLHTEPIISLVDGLLEGDHSVRDCLAKGNFGECLCCMHS